MVRTLREWLARRPRLDAALNHWVVLPWSGLGANAQAAWAAPVIRRSGRLLELGARLSPALRTLYAQRPALRVISVEPDLALARLRQAELQAAGVVTMALVCADPAVLPFAADQFDQLVSLDLLQRVPQPARVIDEMLRVGVDGAAIAGSAGVDVGAEPRGGIQRLLFGLRAIRPLTPETLHELVGLTWSRLSGERTGAVYVFRRPALDRATGEPLPPE